MGPLQGFTVIEMAGIGPVPFCAMMLADLGATVIRIDRPDGSTMHPENPVNRGRRSLALDLKRSGSVEAVLRLLEKADALLEGFRPGVMEKLGLGPEPCLKRNPRLVYGRMTGWGQYGPLANAAGHDINYIALSGALHAMQRDGQPPVPPLNLVGDYGGGAMYLATGVLAALLETGKSGQGQVVDAAMTDGAASLMTLFYGLRASGSWSSRTGENLLDGGAHFYNCYACSDGKFIALGSIEPQFYALLLRLCNIDDPQFLNQMDTASWPELKQKLTELFRTRSRDQWCELLEGSDACFAPVLDMEEAPQHPHNQARKSFVEVDGAMQPAAAPRFSRTAAAAPGKPVTAGAHNQEILRELGFDDEDIAKLLANPASSRLAQR